MGQETGGRRRTRTRRDGGRRIRTYEGDQDEGEGSGRGWELIGGMLAEAKG